MRGKRKEAKRKYEEKTGVGVRMSERECEQGERGGGKSNSESVMERKSDKTRESGLKRVK